MIRYFTVAHKKFRLILCEKYHRQQLSFLCLCAVHLIYSVKPSFYNWLHVHYKRNNILFFFTFSNSLLSLIHNNVFCALLASVACVCETVWLWSEQEFQRKTLLFKMISSTVLKIYCRNKIQTSLLVSNYRLSCQFS